MLSMCYNETLPQLYWLLDVVGRDWFSLILFYVWEQLLFSAEFRNLETQSLRSKLILTLLNEPLRKINDSTSSKKWLKY